MSRRVTILLLLLSVAIVPSSGQNGTDPNTTITLNTTMSPSVVGTVSPGANVTQDNVTMPTDGTPGGGMGGMGGNNETDMDMDGNTTAGATGFVDDMDRNVTNGNETMMPGNIFDQGNNDGMLEDDSGETTIPPSGNATRPPDRPSGNETTPAPGAAEPCTTTEECGGGRFCSSTSMQCEQLSCANWQVGTPEGELTYGEGPCIQEGAEAGTSFCGWDGNCYRYSCENWYQYGPVAFTGFDINNPVDLSCEEFSDGGDENLNSIVFGCRPYQPGSKAPEALTWTHFFNYKCSSTPRGSDEFTCYENVPGANYNDFLGEVSRLNQQSCDREIYDNEQPLYWYIIQMTQIRNEGDPINYKNGRDNTLNTASFDASEADRTMYAVIVSPDEEPPEQPVPEGTEGDGSSAIPSWSGLVSLWLSLLAGALFL